MMRKFKLMKLSGVLVVVFLGVLTLKGCDLISFNMPEVSDDVVTDPKIPELPQKPEEPQVPQAPQDQMTYDRLAGYWVIVPNKATIYLFREDKTYTRYNCSSGYQEKESGTFTIVNNQISGSDTVGHRIEFTWNNGELWWNQNQYKFEKIASIPTSC